MQLGVVPESDVESTRPTDGMAWVNCILLPGLMERSRRLMETTVWRREEWVGTGGARKVGEARAFVSSVLKGGGAI